MMVKKRIVIYCLGILMVVLCSGCAEVQDNQVSDVEVGEEDDNEKIKIGITMASSDSSYLIELVTYIMETIEEEDVACQIMYAQWDAALQEEHMRIFIEEEVDAIILCPTDAKSLLDVLKEADSAEIPVINLNMKVDSISSEYIDTYVGASSIEEGILAAELVVELLEDDGGNVGIIEGEPGSEPATYRTEAFLEEIQTYPQINVVGISCGSWDQTSAYASAWDLATNNKELDIIYSHDSNMALGAYEALVDLGLEDEIQIVSIGENEAYLEALSEGVIDGIVTQSAEYEARTAIYAAINIVKGVSLRPWYKTPAEKLTQENLGFYEMVQY